MPLDGNVDEELEAYRRRNSEGVKDPVRFKQIMKEVLRQRRADWLMSLPEPEGPPGYVPEPPDPSRGRYGKL